MPNFRFAEWLKRPTMIRLVGFLRPHRLTVYQLLITVFLANLPVIISFVVQMVRKVPENPSTAFEIFLGLFKGGDVYVYSAALVAPFWWTLLEYQRRKTEGIWLVWIPFLLSVLCSLVGSVIYALSETNLIRNFSLVNNLAVAIFGASLIVLYWSIYSDRAMYPEVEQPHAQEEQAVDEILDRLDKDAQP